MNNRIQPQESNTAYTEKMNQNEGGWGQAEILHSGSSSIHCTNEWGDTGNQQGTLDEHYFNEPWAC